MHNALISLQNISRIFRTDEVETYALSDISFDIQQNDFVSISGPSGCGKTTLLGIIGLVDTPDSGKMILEGKEVSSLGTKERARLRNERIGYIFQNFNLLEEASVIENVALPLVYRGISKKERLAMAEASLEKVDMAHRKKHRPSQLSGGQQQRVAVARALAGNPAILLADEPTGNLDSENGGRVMDLLSEIHSAGTTICMVTHDQRYADAASRIVHLWDGKMADAAQSQNQVQTQS